MIRVLSTGIMAENNFGAPSILHGLEDLLYDLYGDDYQLIHIQPTPVNKLAVSDFRMEVRYYKYNIRKLLISAWLFRLFRIRTKGVENEIITLINESDIIVDLFGICFCDNFNKSKGPLYKSIISVLGDYPFEFIGKLLGKKTVKNTASFGPMKYLGNQQRARFACNHIFSQISSREVKSFEALRDDAKIKKKIFISPDIANLFKAVGADESSSYVGISVSYQIIKQWDSKDSYIDCIVSLCHHIKNKYNKSIKLIPNEFVSGIGNNDVDIAEEILNKLQLVFNETAEVVAVKNMTSTQLKIEIASCDVMIASRYHACVASLSAGVPLFIIGWHYKYQELAELYGQERWNISSNNCSIESLIAAFDSFYNSKEELRTIIKKRRHDVEQKVFSVGKELFSI